MGGFSLDQGTASSCMPSPITALTLLTTRPEVSLRKRDSAGRKVERAQQDHAGRLLRTLCNGYHDCSPLFPNPLVRHLKSETAYAARGPTDRPPRSWRATHFNQFPWRTAVTTTWSLRRLLSFFFFGAPIEPSQTDCTSPLSRLP
jgi:hypothetical protein